MLRRIDLRGGPAGREVEVLLPRATFDVDSATTAVRTICDAVRLGGATAARELTARFDGVDVDDLRVPAEALADALDGLDAGVRAALREAVRRTRMVHEAQRRSDVTVEVAPGARVTERWLPVRRVGLYVPGGRVAYPSSVVMNVVPAQVAGVGSLAVASPPKPEYGGLPHPAILAACALLGVDEVYRVGGAQAIALFAYGDPAAGIERVDLVTGPGNVYVAAAKRLLRGVVGIDSEAGPTEVAIIADDSADPRHVAADLVAQAEHDPLAACLLVSPSSSLLDAVDRELGPVVDAAHHGDAVRSALSGQSAAVLVDDLVAAVRVSDLWAPEHLEVLTADAESVAATVTNAGAIFVGTYAPVSLGDYLAGSNHVLPTGGTARHSGGLSVGSFLRGVHVVESSRDALEAVSDHIAALGGAEELPAHVAAVRARLP